MTLKKLYLGVEQQPEAPKQWFNSTQEYYHPTKYEASGASLAQVMRTVAGTPAPVRSGGDHGACHPERRTKIHAR